MNNGHTETVQLSKEIWSRRFWSSRSTILYTIMDKILYQYIEFNLIHFLLLNPTHTTEDGY